MSIINRKISIKCQTPKHLTKFYLLSLLPESESAKLVVMVMIIIVVMPAQHMNCAGANLALPRKCTIASDQYIL